MDYKPLQGQLHKQYNMFTCLKAFNPIISFPSRELSSKTEREDIYFYITNIVPWVWTAF